MDGMKWYHAPLLLLVVAAAKVKDAFRGKREGAEPPTRDSGQGK